MTANNVLQEGINIQGRQFRFPLPLSEMPGINTFNAIISNIDELKNLNIYNIHEKKDVITSLFEFDAFFIRDELKGRLLNNVGNIVTYNQQNYDFNGINLEGYIPYNLVTSLSIKPRIRQNIKDNLIYYDKKSLNIFIRYNSVFYHIYNKTMVENMPRYEKRTFAGEIKVFFPLNAVVIGMLNENCYEYLDPYVEQNCPEFIQMLNYYIKYNPSIYVKKVDSFLKKNKPLWKKDKESLREYINDINQEYGRTNNQRVNNNNTSILTTSTSQ